MTHLDDKTALIGRTGFVLDSEGWAIVSVYSIGALGRLVPEDVIGLVKDVRAHETRREAG